MSISSRLRTTCTSLGAMVTAQLLDVHGDEKFVLQDQNIQPSRICVKIWGHSMKSGTHGGIFRGLSFKKDMCEARD